MKKGLTALVVAIVLAGCAPIVFVKYGATEEDYQAAMQECEYDAVKYAGTSDPMMRTSIGAGIDQGMRQRDLKIACMRSKGWKQQ